MNNTFAIHQIQRAISWEGKTYLFRRQKLDTNKEPIKNEYSDDISMKGLFHVSSSPYITITNADSAAVQSKKTPQILAKWDEASLLTQGDILTIGTNTYKVNGVDNVGDLDLVGEISLELRVK